MSGVFSDWADRCRPGLRPRSRSGACPPCTSRCPFLRLRSACLFSAARMPERARAHAHLRRRAHALGRVCGQGRRQAPRAPRRQELAVLVAPQPGHPGGRSQRRRLDRHGFLSRLLDAERRGHPVISADSLRIGCGGNLQARFFKSLLISGGAVCSARSTARWFIAAQVPGAPEAARQCRHRLYPRGFSACTRSRQSTSPARPRRDIGLNVYFAVLNQRL